MVGWRGIIGYEEEGRYNIPSAYRTYLNMQAPRWNLDLLYYTTYIHASLVKSWPCLYTIYHIQQCSIIGMGQWYSLKKNKNKIKIKCITMVTWTYRVELLFWQGTTRCCWVQNSHIIIWDVGMITCILCCYFDLGSQFPRFVFFSIIRYC
jgi:hypothetical protein